MPGGKIGPILLGALRPRRTHEGPWCGQNPTGYELVAASAVRSLGLRLGFTPRFDRGAIELNTRRSTHAERRRPALIVIGLVTFLKPCAFGAPQAASGLDQRHQPNERTAVSSMPSISFAETAKMPLDSRRLILVRPRQ